MSKHQIAIALGMAVLVSTSGCASIMAGGQRSLEVSVDEPENVEVTVRGLNNGEKIVRRDSNFSVPLSRNSDYQITVRADGYESEETIVRRNIQPWFWANICCGTGLVGLGIDFVSNNMWEHDRSQVNIRLEKVRRGRTSLVLPITISDAHGHHVEVIEAPVHKIATK